MISSLSWPNPKRIPNKRGTNGGRELIPSLFGTNLDENNTLLPPGSNDPHYVYINNSNQSFPIPNHIEPFWLPNNEKSGWIGLPSINNGTYKIQTSFSLSNYEISSTTLYIWIAADNTIDSVEINNNIIPLNLSSISSNSLSGPFVITGQDLNPFTITTTFEPNVNTISFNLVNSGPQPSSTGIRIETFATSKRIS